MVILAHLAELTILVKCCLCVNQAIANCNRYTWTCNLACTDLLVNQNWVSLTSFTGHNGLPKKVTFSSQLSLAAHGMLVYIFFVCVYAKLKL